MRILLMPDEPDKDQWWERNAVDERQRNPRYLRSSRRSAAARLPNCGPAHGTDQHVGSVARRDLAAGESASRPRQEHRLAGAASGQAVV